MAKVATSRIIYKTFLTFLLNLYIKILFYKPRFSKIPFLESRIHFLACDFCEFGKEMIFGLLVETDLKWKITNSVLDFFNFFGVSWKCQTATKTEPPQTEKFIINALKKIMRFVNNPNLCRSIGGTTLDCNTHWSKVDSH